MALLKDLLKVSFRESSHDSRNDLAHMQFCVDLGQALHTDYSNAKKRFEKFGAGIYTRFGWYKDSMETRKRISRTSYVAVLVTESKEIIVLNFSKGWNEQQRKKREKKNREYREECAQLSRDLRLIRETERIFESGQTHPQRKRSGKANSLGDIGKYIARPTQKIPEYTIKFIN